MRINAFGESDGKWTTTNIFPNRVEGFGIFKIYFNVMKQTSVVKNIALYYIFVTVYITFLMILVFY